VTTHVDGAVLEGLDFEPVVPCDADGHATSADGCVSTEPGRWVVLLAHYTPDCRPVLAVICDPQYRSTTDRLDGVLNRPREPGSVVLSRVCLGCGTTLTRVSELITVIREL